VSERAGFARLAPDAVDQRFQRLRADLGVTSFGINLVVLAPGERGRVHSHREQEEVYLVLAGELTLLLEDGEAHTLVTGDLARVGPGERRQLVNRGPARLDLLALGGHGEHVGRDGVAWASWDETGEGRSPQEVPLPADEPLG
jgi:uncharacterized cupin superfamily protein